MTSVQWIGTLQFIKLCSQRQFEFASIEDTVRDLKAGRMIVVIDDEDRENEGDLIMAAEMTTPQAINFMATYRRGLDWHEQAGERKNDADDENAAHDVTEQPHDASVTQPLFTVKVMTWLWVRNGIRLF
jgi:3,4-dihydroxy-2-butanone 4-phosphate synthase